MITEEVLNKARQEFAAKAAEFAEKVQPYYVVMHWTWASPDGGDFIPTTKDIVATVEQLANRLKPSGHTTSVDVSSGGIQVSITSYSDLPDHYTAQIDFLPISVRFSV